MPKRDRTVQLFFVLLILVLGTAAYLTRYPDSILVRSAESWPVVGPWAERWRLYFSPEMKESSPVATSTHAGERLAPREAAAPGASAPDGSDPVAIGAHPYVWVPEGKPVRSEANPEAPVVHRTQGLTNLPKLERDGDWFQVLIRRQTGWVHLPGYVEDDGGPPLGRAPDPPGPLPGRAPRAELIAKARQHLSDGSRELRFGPYRVYTDVEDGELLELCDRLARDLERVYSSRFDLDPIGEPAEVVVLYRREADYVALRGQTRRISRLPATGHVGRGMVAVYQGDRPRLEVASTLVHELVHLLNRRGLGPALPPWLDEGLADELGQSEIDPGGALRPGRLGGAAERTGDQVEFSGGRAAALQLRQALEGDEAVSIFELLSLDWQGFVGSERRSVYYAHSSFLIRYLLSGGDPELASSFRSFLAGIARGEPIAADSLRRELGVEWDELEVRFWAWLEVLAAGVEDSATRPG